MIIFGASICFAMNKLYIILFFNLILFSCVLGQEKKVFEHCGNNLLYKDIQLQDTRIETLLEERERSYRRSIKKGFSKTTRSITVLPVVVHVLHSNGAENISNEQVLRAIEDLNLAFRNQGYYDQEIGADTEIEFCLARRDISGNEFNGIIRYTTEFTDMSSHFSNDIIANISSYDALDYINIRVVKDVCIGNDCSRLGYAVNAYTNENAHKNGVVVEAKVFGTSYNDDVVLVHEMGHYLGLKHTFQGGCKNDNCLEDGDNVCDTPPDNNTDVFSCNVEMNSCTTDEDDESLQNPFRSPDFGGLGDQIDQSNNYMDYSIFSCMNQFTVGQAQRMYWFIQNVFPNLLTSTACLPPCENEVMAMINFNNADTTIMAGEPLFLIGSAVNADSTCWTIDCNEVVLGDSLMFNPEMQGMYTLKYIAKSGDLSCEADTISIVAEVLCPVDPEFSFNLQGGELTLINGTQNFTTLEWNIYDGSNIIFTSNNENENTVFSTPGIYTICLEVSNNVCNEQICESIQYFGDGSEHCSNGYDDDGDGYVDSFDDDCSCNNDLYQAHCPNVCQYMPESNQEIKLSLQWESEYISDGFADPSSFAVGNYDSDENIEIVCKGAKGGFLDVSSDLIILNGRNGIIKNSFPIISDYNVFGTTTNLAITRSGVGNVSSYVANYDDLYAYDAQGNEMFSVENSFSTFINSADFDENGVYEIYAGHDVLNSTTGEFLFRGLNSGCFENANCDMVHSIAADILPSEGLELITGKYIYSLDINNNVDTTGNTAARFVMDDPVEDGFCGIADFDLDGQPEIVVLRKNVYGDGGLWVVDPLTGSVISSADISAERAGLPCIGDIDNDCIPEITFVTQNQLQAYRFDGTNTLKRIFQKEIIDQSGAVAPTLFDFDQDGMNEIIHHDHEYLRIIRGTNGSTIDSFRLNNGTAFDFPVVADVDMDGQAEILVNGYRDDWQKQQIFCFESGDGRWAPARSVWNQSAYNVVNVNDDLTIPREVQNPSAFFNTETCLEESCTQPYNGFMQQATFRTQNGCLIWPVDDQNLSIHVDQVCASNDDIQFCLSILEGSSEVFENGISIQSYSYSEETDQYVFVESFTSFTEVFCENISFQGDIDALVFVLNQEGNSYPPDFSNAPIFECDYSNNLAIENIEMSSVTLDLGPDIMRCPNEPVIITAPPGFERYLWSDFSTELSYTAESDGIHFLEVMDTCGVYFRDTVLVTTIENTNISIELNMPGNCPGDTVTAIVSDDFTDVEWFTDQQIPCTNCNTLITSSDTSFVLYVSALYQDCWVSDSVHVVYSLPIEDNNSETICEGDSVWFKNQYLYDEGFYQYTTENCDSIITLELTVHTALSESVERRICEGDTIYLDTIPVFDEGNYVLEYTTIQGCDSIIFYNVLLEEILPGNAEYSICEGDSILVEGFWLKDEGMNTVVTSSFIGCDSTINVLINYTYPELTSIDTSFCEGDSIFLNEQWFSEDTNLELLLETDDNCDSLVMINILELEVEMNLDTIMLCHGDSIYVQDSWIKSDWVAIDTVHSEVCFSVLETHYIFQESVIMDQEFVICPNDSVLIGDQWIYEAGNFQGVISGVGGCDTIIFATVNALESPKEPVITFDCEEIEVLVNVDQVEGWTLIWSNGDTSFNTSYTESGMQEVLFVNNFGCQVSYAFETEIPNPIDLTNLPNDTTITDGDMLEIHLNVDENDWDIMWFPQDIVDCDSCLTAIISANESTELLVEFINDFECIYTHRFSVEVLSKSTLSIANIFSPNGDGLNDVWKIDFSGYNTNETSIFDRWGNEVGHWINQDEIIWDGTGKSGNLVDGVYIYSIRYVDDAGNNISLFGDVTILH